MSAPTKGECKSCHCIVDNVSTHGLCYSCAMDVVQGRKATSTERRPNPALNERQSFVAVPRSAGNYKPGTMLKHEPSGAIIVVAWLANGPRGSKSAPWYWVSAEHDVDLSGNRIDGLPDHAEYNPQSGRWAFLARGNDLVTL